MPAAGDTRGRRRPGLRTAVALVALLVVAACGDDDADQAADGPRATTATTSSQDGGGAATTEAPTTGPGPCGCAYPDVLVFDGSRHGHLLLTADASPPSLHTAIEQLVAHAAG